MELIFATHNQHKLQEVQNMLPTHELISLSDIQFHSEIVEDGSTFAENAHIKAKTIYDKVKKPVFADDSGLVINALDGKPGIHSARFAGTGNSVDNIEKVLQEMSEKEDRSAHFKAVICLILEGEEYFFEGRVDGEIQKNTNGTQGFGYDPIFKPENYIETFAQMNPDLKNRISHRAIAIQKMKEFLHKIR